MASHAYRSFKTLFISLGHVLYVCPINTVKDIWLVSFSERNRFFEEESIESGSVGGIRNALQKFEGLFVKLLWPIDSAFIIYTIAPPRLGFGPVQNLSGA